MVEKMRLLTYLLLLIEVVVNGDGGAISDSASSSSSSSLSSSCSIASSNGSCLKPLDEKGRQVGVKDGKVLRSDGEEKDDSIPEESCEDRFPESCRLLLSKFKSKEEGCISLFDMMDEDCRKTCFICQDRNPEMTTWRNLYSPVELHIPSEEAWEYLWRVDEYMYGNVYKRSKVSRKLQSRCKNFDKNCIIWALEGQCQTNSNFMNNRCAPACFQCDHALETNNSTQHGSFSCQDMDDDCDPDNCISNFDIMQQRCPKTCLLCDAHNDTTARNIYSDQDQVLTTPEQWEYLQQVNQYMYEQVYVQDEFAAIREKCRNTDPLCTFWAMSGECTANPFYMNVQCSAACLRCDYLSFEMRCSSYNLSEPLAWSQPGQLDQMFRRIVEDAQFQLYQPQILSQPPQGPWVVVLDNFLTKQESQSLIEFGAQRGYERSQDVGEQKPDGTYDGKESVGRTSTNAWCVDECWDDSGTQLVHARMENLLQIPKQNYEYLQLLRYEKNQFYEIHHDYIEHQIDRYPGPRILTLFFYLNDVEEGGGTNFPKLNLTVYPKQGRALLWPSVLDQQPLYKDFRTDHQALPVEKGIKYGANAWVHQRDFKKAWAHGCN